MRSRAKPARPYICRLIIFVLVFTPSVRGGVLEHGFGYDVARQLFERAAQRGGSVALSGGYAWRVGLAAAGAGYRSSAGRPGACWLAMAVSLAIRAGSVRQFQLGM